MSHYSQHGQTGGGGVRRRDGGSPSNQSRGYGGGGRHDQPDDKVSKHWPNYLEGGYFDEAGNLKVEYVSRCLPDDEHLPDDKQHGVEPLIRAMANGRPRLTTGQLRRFFGHCRTLETRLKSGASTWLELRTKFLSLDVAASDAYGKSQRKIPGLFYDFIQRNVHAVKNENDFLKGFLPHFEALVGFGSLHVQKDRN